MMIWLAAAAATIAPHPAPRAPEYPAVQAIATVRIISGVRLKLDSPVNEGAPRAHLAMITAGGMIRSASLIEFE